MLCSSPITVTGLGVVGCGQCIPCRINKRREWVGRLTLEAGLYTDNAFLTLTYDDAHLPTVVGPQLPGAPHLLTSSPNTSVTSSNGSAKQWNHIRCVSMPSVNTVMTLNGRTFILLCSITPPASGDKLEPTNRTVVRYAIWSGEHGGWETYTWALSKIVQ